MNKPGVTEHAIDRYIERVDGKATRSAARRVIDAIAEAGKARPVPRRWMKTVIPSPGLRYVYSPDHPGVCLAVKGGAVVTVYSRTVCKRWQASQRAAAPAGRSGKRSRKSGAESRVERTSRRLAA